MYVIFCFFKLSLEINGTSTFHNNQDKKVHKPKLLSTRKLAHYRHNFLWSSSSCKVIF